MTKYLLFLSTTLILGACTPRGADSPYHKIPNPTGGVPAAPNLGAQADTPQGDASQAGSPQAGVAAGQNQPATNSQTNGAAGQNQQAAVPQASAPTAIMNGNGQNPNAVTSDLVLQESTGPMPRSLPV